MNYAESLDRTTSAERIAPDGKVTYFEITAEVDFGDDDDANEEPDFDLSEEGP